MVSLIRLQQIPHPPPDLPLEGGGTYRFPSPSGGGLGWALNHVRFRTSHATLRGAWGGQDEDLLVPPPLHPVK